MMRAMDMVQLGSFCMTWVILLDSCSPQLLDYDRPGQLRDFLINITFAHQKYSSLIELINTYEHQPIYCVKIGKGNSSRPVVIVEFGAHAREWASHTSATHVIYELLNNPKYDEIITNVTWYIVPLLNPDGFRYSKNFDRSWLKNRRPVNETCVGVNVNSNFPENWERHPTCGNEYSGEHSSSERETQAIIKLFGMIPNEKVDAYISVHSDGQCILLPYGNSYVRTEDWTRLYDVALKMKSAMELAGPPIYEVALSSDVFLITGTSVDWAYASKKVPLAFTLELPFQITKRSYAELFRSSRAEKTIIARQCLAALETCALQIMRPSSASIVLPWINSSLGILLHSSICFLSIRSMTLG